MGHLTAEIYDRLPPVVVYANKTDLTNLPAYSNEEEERNFVLANSFRIISNMTPPSMLKWFR